MIKIDYLEFQRLKDIEILLECLEDGGVENWEGYEEAMKNFYEYDD